MSWKLLPAGVAVGLLAACTSMDGDPMGLFRVDHMVRVISTAPSIAGQEAQLYVREVIRTDLNSRGAAPAGVVLFVHGANVPAEVSFDLPYRDYSWMAYLARAGFAVYSLDMTGYGRSTRPQPMSDPCNFPAEQQAQFVPVVIPAPCAPSLPTPITTVSSDWNDLDAVVEYLRTLRRVEQVSLVGWSQAGPRTGGYAARNPSRVARLVLLAPNYLRDSALEAPDPLPSGGGWMRARSRKDIDTDWDRQVGCPGQYEPGVSETVWSRMLASDPVGAKWGPGVSRAPRVPLWGFNRAVVAKLEIPYLMVTGEHDKVVPPDRVRQLYADLGSKQKVLIDLACSSHNAPWEKNHLLLFQASLEWLRDGKVNGVSEGIMRLGY